MGGAGCEVTLGLAKVELRMRGVQILIRAITSSTHLKQPQCIVASLHSSHSREDLSTRALHALLQNCG